VTMLPLIVVIVESSSILFFLLLALALLMRIVEFRFLVPAIQAALGKIKPASPKTFLFSGRENKFVSALNASNCPVFHNSSCDTEIPGYPFN